MGTFSIQGGTKLKGEVIPQGAKNEALQVICSCLLYTSPSPRDVEESRMPSSA